MGQLESRLDFIEKFYEDLHPRNEPAKYTKIVRIGEDIATFVPSQTRLIARGLKGLLDEGIIREGEQFLDAGSGDGRVVAIASLLNLNASGIEYDSDLSDLSKKALGALNDHLHFTFTPRIDEGDFVKEGDFSRPDIFFNYFNNYIPLGKRIAKESKQGSRYVLFSSYYHVPMEGLKPIGEIDEPMLYGRADTKLIPAQSLSVHSRDRQTRFTIYQKPFKGQSENQTQIGGINHGTSGIRLS